MALINRVRTRLYIFDVGFCSPSAENIRHSAPVFTSNPRRLGPVSSTLPNSEPIPLRTSAREATPCESFFLSQPPVSSSAPSTRPQTSRSGDHVLPIIYKD